jgi:antitoxin (DNA-binding transcriptional repressor) of toxin-antitoxin stability system
VAKLVPIKEKPKRQFGLYAGLATVGPEFFDPLPEEELRLWEGRGDEEE